MKRKKPNVLNLVMEDRIAEKSDGTEPHFKQNWVFAASLFYTDVFNEVMFLFTSNVKLIEDWSECCWFPSKWCRLCLHLLFSSFFPFLHTSLVSFLSLLCHFCLHLWFVSSNSMTFCPFCLLFLSPWSLCPFCPFCLFFLSPSRPYGHHSLSSTLG